MFSPKDPIHLVFANDADTYYQDNLLRLTLDQKLWLTLHESGCSAVYFLGSDGDCFTIKTFGEPACKPYEGELGLKKVKRFFADRTRLDGFCAWMLKQMKNPVAFVCSLEDFCEVIRPDWSDPAQSLSAMAADTKRKGILVLKVPPAVERSRALLLHSSAFDRLGAAPILSVRSGEVRPFYYALKTNLGDACVFWNTYTRETISAILTQITVRYYGRQLSSAQFDRCVDYLHRYLNSLSMQQTDPLFQTDALSSELLFSELFTQLLDNSVWRRLLVRSESVETRASVEELAYPVTRDKSGAAGRCLRMRLPKWAATAENTSDLLSIREELLAPKNHEDNEALLSVLNSLCGKLEGLWENDCHTCRRVLHAIRFCVSRLYLPAEGAETERVLGIAEKLEQNIVYAADLFGKQRDLRISSATAADAGSVMEKKLSQSRASVKAMERMVSHYEDLVDASIVTLSFAGDSLAQLESLEQEVNRLMNAAESEAPHPQPAFEAAAAAEQQPEPDDYEYVLTKADYSYKPPKSR